MTCFLESLEVYFFDNINIKVSINSLLDNFEINYIIFLFFFNLKDNNRFDLPTIYYILDIFSFKHDLHKISLLKTIFKNLKLFFLIFVIAILVDYKKKRLKRKIIAIASAYTRSYNLRKYIYIYQKHINF